MQQSVQKRTLVPVYRTAWTVPTDTRIDLGGSISFESVENLLKPESFELWRQYVSEDARKSLSAVRFALVHRFSSSAHVGPAEQKSVELMQRVFVCLRLIKPTKAIWSNIQFRDTPEGIDVFSFTHPTERIAATPEAEAFNEIDLYDIRRLQQLLDAFLELVDNGPLNVRSAIRHYELGYSEVQDDVLQFVTWMMALEQFYSSGEDPVPPDELMRKISDYVDIDQDIYAETQFREVFPALPAITAREALPNLFILRNRFVHGLWVQKEWLAPARIGTLYEKTSYADVLREVVSWLVRKSLVNYLETTSSARR